MSLCPCGSGSSFASCCEIYLENNENAPTAEVLMRSRYTAFTKAKMDYLSQTHHPKTRNELDIKGTEKWARSADWEGLEIIQTSAGQNDDNSGVVEFKARYRLQGELCILHEVSQFEKKQGKWFYVDGTTPEIRQYRREAPKIGRNDPCVCGSGKKYKKCCGIN